MKRVLSFIVATMFAGQVWAESFTVDGLKYTIIEGTKTVSVTRGVNIPTRDLVIHATVENNGITYTITSIEARAFMDNARLTSVTIPNSIKSIGDAAFNSCINLTSVTISESVISIGKSVFSSCNNLMEINVESGNIKYTSQDGVLFNIDKTTIVRYPAGKNETEYSIPNTVRSIGRSAFYECTNLTSVTIPNTVTNIDEYAFCYCSGLSSVNIPNSVISISNDAFAECSGLMSVTIPRSVTSMGLDAFAECRNATFYCECEESSKPSGWDSYWNNINRSIKWGCRVVSAPPYCVVHVEASITGENYELIDNTGALWFLKDAVEPTVTVTFNLDRGYHWSDRKSRVPYIITEPVTASKTYISNDIAVTCEAHRVFDAAVAPTCTETGLTLGAHCSVCGDVSMAQEVVPINSSNHNYGAPTYEWSEGNLICTATKACAYNSEHNITETADATSTVTVAPTCEAVGTRTFSAEFTSEDFAAQQTTEEIAATGHTYSSAITAPTCTTVGFTTHTCSVCEHTYNSDTIAAKGHKADSVEFENIVPATCTVAGSKDSVVFCSVCQVEVSREERTIPAIGHTEVTDAAVAATCTAAGKTEGKHCSVCNAVLVAQQDVDELGHTEVTDAAVAATCTAAGKTEGKHCSVCNETIVAQTEIPALGHEFKDYVYNNDATTAADGTETAVCERGCGTTDTRVAEGTKLSEPEKGTAVTDAATSTLNIYTRNNVIVIENAAEEISVYDAMGRLICRDAINRVRMEKRTEIRITAPGIYIVKVGVAAKRVMVN